MSEYLSQEEIDALLKKGQDDNAICPGWRNVNATQFVPARSSTSFRQQIYNIEFVASVGVFE